MPEFLYVLKLQQQLADVQLQMPSAVATQPICHVKGLGSACCQQ
jgi:hypothetical protein